MAARCAPHVPSQPAVCPKTRRVRSRYVLTRRRCPLSLSAVPNVLWAERKDTVFLTVEVADVTAPEVKVEDDGHVTFSGTSDGKHYALDLHLAGALVGSESKVAVLPRHIVLALTKASPGPHWGKLLAGGKAPHYVKVDWTKYKDEDEEEAEGKGTF